MLLVTQSAAEAAVRLAYRVRSVTSGIAVVRATTFFLGKTFFFQSLPLLTAITITPHYLYGFLGLIFCFTLRTHVSLRTLPTVNAFEYQLILYTQNL